MGHTGQRSRELQEGLQYILSSSKGGQQVPTWVQAHRVCSSQGGWATSEVGTSHVPPAPRTASTAFAGTTTAALPPPPPMAYARVCQPKGQVQHVQLILGGLGQLVEKGLVLGGRVPAGGGVQGFGECGLVLWCCRGTAVPIHVLRGGGYGVVHPRRLTQAAPFPGFARCLLNRAWLYSCCLVHQLGCL